MEEEGEVHSSVTSHKRKIVPNTKFLKHLVNSVTKTNEPLYRVEKNISSVSSSSSSSSYASFQLKGEQEILQLKRLLRAVYCCCATNGQLTLNLTTTILD